MPAVREPEGERAVAVRELNHIALQVTDLFQAETFYAQFLTMDIVGRARRAAHGGFEALERQLRLGRGDARRDRRRTSPSSATARS